MKTLIIGLFALASFCAPLSAQKAKPTIPELIEELKKDHKELKQRQNDSATPVEKAKIDQLMSAKLDVAMAALEADPKNPDAAKLAATAVKFVNGPANEDRFAAFAGKLLPANTQLAVKVVFAIGWENPSFLDKLSAATPSAEVKSLVNLVKAYGAAERWEEHGKKEDADEALRLIAAIPREAKPILSGGKDYDYAKKAARIKYSIEHLSVGKTLPDFASRDFAGKPVKLSDFAGQVVLLDVWATWCIDCRRQIPHQRELVERLKGKPFALISISVDDSVQEVEEFQRKEKMPWHHWYEGTKGEIDDKLGIRFLPTLFLIDATGVIRFKNPNDESIDVKKLDKTIDELLAAVPKPAVAPNAGGSAKPR